jgi:acetamidase/formamidase
VPSYSELATPLPVYTLKRPILHTDLLMASLSRHFKVCVTIAPDAPPALKTAVQRLPMRLVHRRTATPEDAVPAASVKVTLPDNSSQIITAPDALAKAVMALSLTN